MPGGPFRCTSRVIRGTYADQWPHHGTGLSQRICPSVRTSGRYRDLTCGHKRLADVVERRLPSGITETTESGPDRRIAALPAHQVAGQLEMPMMLRELLEDVQQHASRGCPDRRVLVVVGRIPTKGSVEI